ncbi:helix-turn-helix domain-containing protein [Paenibacillus sp. NPDC101420]|uniref:helix-turn-helix domain-containing protein n=1 Tax=Paenibacillus sp. NPDC101420 TaxID=3390602 RepID=UPI003CFC50F2
MLVGEKIKAVRKQRKLTQNDLAIKANISRSYLADVEGGRYNPSLDTLKSIATALNTELSTLLENGSTVPEFELTHEKKNEMRNVLHDSLLKAQEIFDFTEDENGHLTQYIDNLNKRYSALFVGSDLAITNRSLNDIYRSVQSMDVQSNEFLMFQALLNELIDLKLSIAIKKGPPVDSEEPKKIDIFADLNSGKPVMYNGRLLTETEIEKYRQLVKIMFE